MSEQLGFEFGDHAPGSPPDEAARERIRNDLDSTLFVEAGAGAGKTTSLVERIARLVDSGVDITGIAAITFTEKAAAELRARVRTTLAEFPTVAAKVALERLDHAPIGTLHAFARRILFEFPIEAGLPPGFTVLDELESGLTFEEQWHDLLDQLLDEPEPIGGIIDGGRAFVALCEFDGFGIRTGMRRVADDFRANWDLVADRVDRADPGPLQVDVGPLLEIVERIAATDVPPDDSQATIVATIAALGDQLRDAENLRTRLEAVNTAAEEFGGWSGRKRWPGNKTEWKNHLGAAGPDALDVLRADEVSFGVTATELRNTIRHHRRLLLGAVVGRFVLRAAHERAESGRLEFHDLLVIARRLLATRGDIRSVLHDRYPRVLLDEFQDTDPIQLEIAVRLASDPADPAHDDWTSLVPLPGRLFIVGDPKQSIYRFRRADIAQYLRAAEQVGADQLALSANFRSTTAVIDFVNDVFGRLITFALDTQPTFGALDACRPTALLGHGTVTVLGAEIHQPGGSPGADVPALGDPEMGDADSLRLAEAAEIASAISAALHEGWLVYDEHLPVDEGSDLDHERGGLRRCRPGDICVLLPTRISLPSLEGELRAAGIPYRAENSAVVYATQEIRDLLLALRAADDPTDALAVVASLRSAMYGCSDVELFEWVDSGGTWNLWAEPPPTLRAHPVADGLDHLRSIAERIGWVSPADLLSAVVDERRVFDVALAGASFRDVWRRLRYVIEQARAWADAGGHGVRRYLHWATMQASESRVADTILPEHDHDAVRVMTIHAAKGLEFPITMVAGLTTRPKRSQASGVVWAGNTWMLAGRGDDGVFLDQQPIDEQMSDAERRRLLYVACTRAIDHLVVSLHRLAPAKNNPDGADEGKLTSAELLWHSGASATSSGAVAAAFDRHPPVAPGVEALTLDWSDHDAWSSERNRAVSAASRRTGIAATRLAEELQAVQIRDEVDDPGLDKQPVNVEQPPWQRGRYGTSIGRAVHGVLQFCDLDRGTDIDTLARSQCAAEGVIGLEAQVAMLARSAITAPIVRTVVGGAAHWRELFVAAVVGDRVLEGYVDMLVRTSDGLVIVDYKTDQWAGPVQTGERIGRYRLQLAAYGAALESVLGESIVGGILVRSRPTQPAEQIVIDRWQDALDEVRLLVR